MNFEDMIQITQNKLISRNRSHTYRTKNNYCNHEVIFLPSLF
ncbi:MAG: hypothetical protein CM15mP130_0890 [Verrucomicrobiota bacterium]|nr:MAG: hypothetical protein CM15mP130_0890 [Verrucomicrobiota bacterium]